MLHDKHAQEEPLFINLTPMIDVILTLLVFFMTATKFYDADENQLEVKVPQVAAAPPLTQPPDDLVINVNESGEIIVGGDVLTLDQLKTRLAEAKENYPDQAVTVRADGRTMHQNVADVLSSCYAAGISKTVLAVRPLAAE